MVIITNWYRGIMPCSACEHSGHLTKFCYKEHDIIFVEGCRDCGTMVNGDWYYNKIKCPDFEQRYFDDPSGS